MAYDVFVVSALEDRDMANLVVRRLRALKFKCWFDKKQTDTTFDQKDARNALNSKTMLVLWSENAVKSDWVRAAASVGNSRPGMLLELALDETVPYEPFAINKRYSLKGMTTRTTVEGFYEFIEELGRRDGRVDLRQWLLYGKGDEAKKTAWLEAHPKDPLALAEQKKREKERAAAVKNELVTVPDDPGADAAALAASTMSQTANTDVEAVVLATDDDGVIGKGYADGVGKVPGTPGARSAPGRKGPAGVAAAAATTPAYIAATDTPASSTGLGRYMVPGLLGAIALMFLFGWAARSSPASTIAGVANPHNGTGKLTAGSEIIMAGDSCPAGFISSRSLAPLPETNRKEAEEE